MTFCASCAYNAHQIRFGDINDPPIKDDTNLSHPYQGTLRFALFDHDSIAERIKKDIANYSIPHSIALTWADWKSDIPSPVKVSMKSYGPRRDQIEEILP